MEQEGEMFDDEAYSYPHESNVKESELIDWKEHEATLNKEEETELIIKPNKYSFDNNELTLSDYLELKTVHAWGIDFQGVNFVNLPKLNNLYLSKVKYSIKETRLSDIENLTNLVNLTLTGINYSFFLV
jgi:serine protease inhibitor ecotin